MLVTKAEALWHSVPVTALGEGHWAVWSVHGVPVRPIEGRRASGITPEGLI